MSASSGGSFWFPPYPAARLAALRILIGGFATLYILVCYPSFVRLAAGDASMFRPVGVAALLSGPINAWLFHFLVLATLILGIGFTAGYRYRIVGPSFAALLLFVMCYRNSWTMIFHDANLFVIHVIVLGIVPAADALSLDARARRVDSVADGMPIIGLRYGWPVRLIGAATTAAYCVAGIAKLAGPMGWSWVSGSALQGYIYRDGLRKVLLGSDATPLAYLLADNLWLLTVFAALTLVFELGAPVALLQSRVGKVWAVLTWCMHIGILCMMGIGFAYQLSFVAFASFFSLERARMWRGLRG